MLTKRSFCVHAYVQEDSRVLECSSPNLSLSTTTLLAPGGPSSSVASSASVLPSSADMYQQYPPPQPPHSWEQMHAWRPQNFPMVPSSISSASPAQSSLPPGYCPHYSGPYSTPAHSGISLSLSLLLPQSIQVYCHVLVDLFPFSDVPAPLTKAPARTEQV